MKNEITFMFMGTLTWEALPSKFVHVEVKRYIIIATSDIFCSAADQFDILDKRIDAYKEQIIAAVAKATSETVDPECFYWSSRSLVQLKDWSRD